MPAHHLQHQRPRLGKTRDRLDLHSATTIVTRSTSATTLLGQHDGAVPELHKQQATPQSPATRAGDRMVGRDEDDRGRGSSPNIPSTKVVRESPAPPPRRSFRSAGIPPEFGLGSNCTPESTTESDGTQLSTVFETENAATPAVPFTAAAAKEPGPGTGDGDLEHRREEVCDPSGGSEVQPPEEFEDEKLGQPVKEEKIEGAVDPEGAAESPGMKIDAARGENPFHRISNQIIQMNNSQSQNKNQKISQSSDESAATSAVAAASSNHFIKRKLAYNDHTQQGSIIAHEAIVHHASHGHHDAPHPAMPDQGPPPPYRDKNNAPTPMLSDVAMEQIEQGMYNLYARGAGIIITDRQNILLLRRRLGPTTPETVAIYAPRRYAEGWIGDRVVGPPTCEDPDRNAIVLTLPGGKLSKTHRPKAHDVRDPRHPFRSNVGTERKEDPSETFARELYEETGIELKSITRHVRPVTIEAPNPIRFGRLTTYFVLAVEERRLETLLQDTWEGRDAVEARKFPGYDLTPLRNITSSERSYAISDRNEPIYTQTRYEDQRVIRENERIISRVGRILAREVAAEISRKARAPSPGALPEPPRSSSPSQSTMKEDRQMTTTNIHFSLASYDEQIHQSWSFKLAFRGAVADATNCPISRIEIVRVTPGSVNVDIKWPRFAATTMENDAQASLRVEKIKAFLALPSQPTMLRDLVHTELSAADAEVASDSEEESEAPSPASSPAKPISSNKDMQEKLMRRLLEPRTHERKMRIMPDNFNGESDVIVWLFDLEAFFEYNETNKASRFRNLQVLLKGEAQSTLKMALNMPHLKAAQEANDMPLLYDLVKTQLIETYTSANFKSETQQDLMKIRQYPNESVKQFNIRFREGLQKCEVAGTAFTNVVDSVKIELYTSKLTLALQNDVQRASALIDLPSALFSYMNKVQEMDMKSNQRHSTADTTTKPQPKPRRNLFQRKRGGRNGSMLKQAYGFPASSPAPPAAAAPQRQTSQNTSGTPTNGERKCYNCGETTHLARECPHPKKVECWNCGDNHYARDCPNNPSGNAGRGNAGRGNGQGNRSGWKPQQRPQRGRGGRPGGFNNRRGNSNGRPSNTGGRPKSVSFSATTNVTPSNKKQRSRRGRNSKPRTRGPAISCMASRGPPMSTFENPSNDDFAKGYAIYALERMPDLEKERPNISDVTAHISLSQEFEHHPDRAVYIMKGSEQITEDPPVRPPSEAQKFHREMLATQKETASSTRGKPDNEPCKCVVKTVKQAVVTVINDTGGEYKAADGERFKSANGKAATQLAQFAEARDLELCGQWNKAKSLLEKLRADVQITEKGGHEAKQDLAPAQLAERPCASCMSQGADVEDGTEASCHGFKRGECALCGFAAPGHRSEAQEVIFNQTCETMKFNRALERVLRAREVEREYRAQLDYASLSQDEKAMVRSLRAKVAKLKQAVKEFPDWRTRMWPSSKKETPTTHHAPDTDSLPTQPMALPPSRAAAHPETVPVRREEPLPARQNDTSTPSQGEPDQPAELPTSFPLVYPVTRTHPSAPNNELSVAEVQEPWVRKQQATMRRLGKQLDRRKGPKRSQRLDQTIKKHDECKGDNSGGRKRRHFRHNRGTRKIPVDTGLSELFDTMDAECDAHNERRDDAAENTRLATPASEDNEIDAFAAKHKIPAARSLHEFERWSTAPDPFKLRNATSKEGRIHNISTAHDLQEWIAEETALAAQIAELAQCARHVRTRVACPPDLRPPVLRRSSAQEPTTHMPPAPDRQRMTCVFPISVESPVGVGQNPSPPETEHQAKPDEATRDIPTLSTPELRDKRKEPTSPPPLVRTHNSSQAKRMRPSLSPGWSVTYQWRNNLKEWTWKSSLGTGNELKIGRLAGPDGLAPRESLLSSSPLLCKLTVSEEGTLFCKNLSVDGTEFIPRLHGGEDMLRHHIGLESRWEPGLNPQEFGLTSAISNGLILLGPWHHSFDHAQPACGSVKIDHLLHSPNHPNQRRVSITVKDLPSDTTPRTDGAANSLMTLSTTGGVATAEPTPEDTTKEEIHSGTSSATAQTATRPTRPTQPDTYGEAGTCFRSQCERRCNCPTVSPTPHAAHVSTMPSQAGVEPEGSPTTETPPVPTPTAPLELRLAAATILGIWIQRLGRPDVISLDKDARSNSNFRDTRTAMQDRSKTLAVPRELPSPLGPATKKEWERCIRRFHALLVNEALFSDCNATSASRSAAPGLYISALIYMRRWLEKTATRWWYQKATFRERRKEAIWALIVALRYADRFWDDNAVCTEDYCMVQGVHDRQRFLHEERQFAHILDWNLFITDTQFTECVAEINQFAKWCLESKVQQTHSRIRGRARAATPQTYPTSVLEQPMPATPARTPVRPPTDGSPPSPTRKRRTPVLVGRMPQPSEATRSTLISHHADNNVLPLYEVTRDAENSLRGLRLRHDIVRLWLGAARCREHNPKYRADAWRRIALEKALILKSNMLDRVCAKCISSAENRTLFVDLSEKGRHSFAHECTSEESARHFKGGRDSLAVRRRVWKNRHKYSRHTTGTIADAMDDVWEVYHAVEQMLLLADRRLDTYEQQSTRNWLLLIPSSAFRFFRRMGAIDDEGPSEPAGPLFKALLAPSLPLGLATSTPTRAVTQSNTRSPTSSAHPACVPRTSCGNARQRHSHRNHDGRTKVRRQPRPSSHTKCKPPVNPKKNRGISGETKQRPSQKKGPAGAAPRCHWCSLRKRPMHAVNGKHASSGHTRIFACNDCLWDACQSKVFPTDPHGGRKTTMKGQTTPPKGERARCETPSLHTGEKAPKAPPGSRGYPKWAGAVSLATMVPSPNEPSANSREEDKIAELALQLTEDLKDLTEGTRNDSTHGALLKTARRASELWNNPEFRDWCSLAGAVDALHELFGAQSKAMHKGNVEISSIGVEINAVLGLLSQFNDDPTALAKWKDSDAWWNVHAAARALGCIGGNFAFVIINDVEKFRSWGSSDDSKLLALVNQHQRVHEQEAATTTVDWTKVTAELHDGNRTDNYKWQQCYERYFQIKKRMETTAPSQPDISCSPNVELPGERRASNWGVKAGTCMRHHEQPGPKRQKTRTERRRHQRAHVTACSTRDDANTHGRSPRVTKWSGTVSAKSTPWAMVAGRDTPRLRLRALPIQPPKGNRRGRHNPKEENGCELITMCDPGSEVTLVSPSAMRRLLDKGCAVRVEPENESVSGIGGLSAPRGAIEIKLMLGTKENGHPAVVKLRCDAHDMVPCHLMLGWPTLERWETAMMGGPNGSTAEFRKFGVSRALESIANCHTTCAYEPFDKNGALIKLQRRVAIPRGQTRWVRAVIDALWHDDLVRFRGRPMQTKHSFKHREEVGMSRDDYEIEPTTTTFTQSFTVRVKISSRKGVTLEQGQVIGRIRLHEGEQASRDRPEDSTKVTMATSHKEKEVEGPDARPNFVRSNKRRGLEATCQTCQWAHDLANDAASHVVRQHGRPGNPGWRCEATHTRHSLTTRERETLEEDLGDLVHETLSAEYDKDYMDKVEIRQSYRNNHLYLIAEHTVDAEENKPETHWGIPVQFPGATTRIPAPAPDTIEELHTGQPNAPIRRRPVKTPAKKENPYAVQAGLRGIEVATPTCEPCSTNRRSVNFCGFCHQKEQPECSSCHRPPSECGCANPHDCNYWRHVWNIANRPRERDSEAFGLPSSAAASRYPASSRVWPYPTPDLQGKSYYHHPAHDELMTDSEQELERPELDIGLDRYNTDNQIPPLHDPAVQAVLEEISWPEDPDMASQLRPIIEEHYRIFLPLRPSDRVTAAMHVIDTGDHPPIKCQPYPINDEKKLKYLYEEIPKLLEGGFIEVSDAEWQSPIVCVQKKEPGTYRMACDYRRLNEITKEEVWTMPSCSESIDRLAGSSVFSSMDCVSGFYQILMHPDSCDKTTVALPRHYGATNRYRFTRMPFGLKNAPATFQKVMDKLFGNVRHALAYIDDIIIFSDDWETHLTHVRLTLETLAKHNFKLAPKKSKFGKSSIPWLGFVVSKEGVAVDTSKTEAITKLPHPGNIRQLQRYMGSVNYFAKWIPSLAVINKPLRNLLKKDTPWYFDDDCKEAMAEINRHLTSPPIMAFPDASKQFVLVTDASRYGVGGCLSVRPVDSDDPTLERPVMYFSQSLSKAETNWDARQLEAYALLVGLERCRSLIGTRKIICFTDHVNLTFMFRHSPTAANSILGSKLMRWASRLAGFNFELRYKRGVDNTMADYLSRVKYEPESEDVIATTATVSRNTVKESFARQDQMLSLDSNMMNSVCTITDETQHPLNSHIQEWPLRDSWDDSADLELPRGWESLVKGAREQQTAYPTSVGPAATAPSEAPRTQQELPRLLEPFDPTPYTRLEKNKNRDKYRPELWKITEEYIELLQNTAAPFSFDWNATPDGRTSLCESFGTKDISPYTLDLGGHYIYAQLDWHEIEAAIVFILATQRRSPNTGAMLIVPVFEGKGWYRKYRSEFDVEITWLPGQKFLKRFNEEDGTFDLPISVPHKVEAWHRRPIESLEPRSTEWQGTTGLQSSIEKEQDTCPWVQQKLALVRKRDGNRKLTEQEKVEVRSFCELGGTLRYRVEQVRELVRQPRLVVSPQGKMKGVLLHAYHQGRGAAHPGVTKMYRWVSQSFFWMGMFRDIKSHVNNCVACLMAKRSRPHGHGLLISPVHSMPLTQMSMDIWSAGVASREGFTKVLTLQCTYSMFLFCEPLRNETAAETARGLLRVYFRCGGFASVVSDLGPNFRSKLMKEVSALLGFKATFLSAYNPRAARCERAHKDLNAALRAVADTDGSDWVDNLQAVLFALNSAPMNTGSGFYSPHLICFGRDSRLPIQQELDSDRFKPKLSRKHDDFIREFKDRCNKVRVLYAAELARVKEKSNVKANEKRTESNLEKGMLVLLFRPRVRKGTYELDVSRKLSSTWSGPFEIVDRVRGTNTWKIVDAKGEQSLAHSSRLAKLPHGAKAKSIRNEGTHYQVARAWITIEAQINRSLHARLNCNIDHSPEGWCLDDVSLGPVATAGIRKGDIISKVNDVAVTKATTQGALLNLLKANKKDTLKITILRKPGAALVAPLRNRGVITTREEPLAEEGSLTKHPPPQPVPLKSYMNAFEEKYERKPAVTGTITLIKEQGSLHVAEVLEDESLLQHQLLLHFYTPLERKGGLHRTFKKAFYAKSNPDRVRTTPKKGYLSWVSTRLSQEVIFTDVTLTRGKLARRDLKAANAWIQEQREAAE